MNHPLSFFRKINTTLSTKIVVGLLVLSAAIATLMPHVWARINTGDAWRGVTPELSYDAMYYYARANDVTRGHFFVTNPYFFEHRNEQSPNPSMNDNIIALPQLLGFSFNTGYYANIFIWGFVLLSLLYVFFRTFSLSPLASLLGSLWCYLGVYGDMLRPGTMQVIYPLYILFLLLFWRYIDQKEENVPHGESAKGADLLRGVLPLAIAAGITAYFYIFLFMTIAATLGIYFLVLLWSRNWPELRRIALAGAIAIGVSLPHIIHTLLLASQEFYAETLVRISFISSHWPQIEAYYYGRWVILVLLLVSVLRRWCPDGISRTAYFFVTITGVGILIAMVSNVFIGQDFMIAFHVAKFSVIWYLTIAVIVLPAVHGLLMRRSGIWFKRLVVGLLFFVFSYQMIMNVGRSVPHFSLMKEKFVEVQSYAGVLSWFKNQPEGVVIAPEDLNSYIPTLTRQYELYNAYGAQFIVNDDEIRERFLLYHAFDNLTEEEFMDTHGKYPYGHTPSNLANVSAMRHQLCMLIRKDCSPAKVTPEFVDVPAMQKKFEAYYMSLTPHIKQEYARYHVRYVVSDVDTPHPILGSPLCPVVYGDQWFEVCEFVLGL